MNGLEPRFLRQEVTRMSESQTERRRRFDAVFASYSSDIVAYCGWRAVLRAMRRMRWPRSS